MAGMLTKKCKLKTLKPVFKDQSDHIRVWDQNLETLKSITFCICVRIYSQKPSSDPRCPELKLGNIQWAPGDGGDFSTRVRGLDFLMYISHSIMYGIFTYIHLSYFCW